uniref:Protein FAM136A n=1 Tax=Homalodisca liturata TaxID=320908 RepID=A0A1B6JBT5_9HEMI
MEGYKRDEVHNAYEKQVNYIDKMYLRDIKKEMFECSAKCCENKTASVEEVNYCVEKCSVKYQESHNYCINEFNNYQHRLQRCVSECNDAAKDKLGAQNSSAEVEAASKMFEDCARTCIDKHVQLLPQFAKNVQEVLSQKMGKNKVKPG